jgi:hypothetical protein
MASFSAGTTFTDGVANDVTAAKLAALVNAATPTSGLIQDRTAETTIAADDTLLFGDFSDSDNLKRMTVANFNNVVTTGTGTAAAPAIQPTGDTNTGIFFPAADTIAFSEGGAEAMRIDSSGQVGIGTTSPSSPLVVSRNANDTLTRLILDNPNAGSSAQTILGLSNDGGTAAGLKLGSSTYSGTGGANALDLFNNASHTILSTGGVERLRIDSSGQVGIGTTSPSAQLELSTDSAKKPSTNTWTIASDQRLKTNITNADNDRCYEIVKQVPLKRYTWKNEVYSQEQVKDRSKLGWIAQDVEAVFPKAVGTNRFAYNQVFEDVVTPELDSDGNAVLDENGVAKTKTEKRLVSEEVIEDCKDLNSDQIYAAMYGTIQKLIEKVEFLESKVAILEAA